jgi:hypothetical protein
MTNEAGLQFAFSQELTSYNGEQPQEESIVEQGRARFGRLFDRFISPGWVAGALGILSIVFAPFYREGRFSWHLLADYDYHRTHKGSEDFLILEWLMIAVFGIWWSLRRKRQATSRVPLYTVAFAVLALLFPPTFRFVEHSWYSRVEFEHFTTVFSGEPIIAGWLGAEILLIMLVGFGVDYVRNLRGTSHAEAQ